MRTATVAALLIIAATFASTDAISEGGVDIVGALAARPKSNGSTCEDYHPNVCSNVRKYDQCKKSPYANMCPETCGRCSKPKPTPTPKPEPTPTPSGCEDYDSYTCYKYKKWGYCKYDLIARHCRASCGKCTPSEPAPKPTPKSTPKGCTDYDSHMCGKYKQYGYCKYTHIKRQCPDSCGHCDDSKPSCEDYSGGWCMKYAKHGLCEYDKISKACPVSCKLCDNPEARPKPTRPPMPDGCTNYDEHWCNYYDRYGFCKFPYVAKACPKACNTCDTS